MAMEEKDYEIVSRLVVDVKETKLVAAKEDQSWRIRIEMEMGRTLSPELKKEAERAFIRGFNDAADRVLQAIRLHQIQEGKLS